MSDQEVENLIETIMRQYYMGSYEKYNDETIRNYWRQKIRGDNNETVVREQPGQGESNS